MLSRSGDQFARVALTMPVYDHTRSGLLAVKTFAAGMVSAFIGGITLCGLTHRLSRRVMIGVDLSSMGTVAVTDVPVPLLLLVAVSMTTNLSAQVAGFAAGGIAVAFLGMRVSLLTDAATFCASALIIRTWVGPGQYPPLSRPPPHTRPHRDDQATDGTPNPVEPFHRQPGRMRYMGGHL